MKKMVEMSLCLFDFCFGGQKWINDFSRLIVSFRLLLMVVIKSCCFCWKLFLLHFMGVKHFSLKWNSFFLFGGIVHPSYVRLWIFLPIPIRGSINFSPVDKDNTKVFVFKTHFHAKRGCSGISSTRTDQRGRDSIVGFILSSLKVNQ